MAPKGFKMLDEKLLQQRLQEFEPEPLVDFDVEAEKQPLETHAVEESEHVIDLAKVNYLNVLNSEDIRHTSEEIVKKYGVGTCGPRAFYGTTDVHLDVERCIADFLNVEECIVYSYGFVAISSSIAAYCKKNDYVFIDEHANFPIHQGLTASRSKVVTFKHNDAKDFRSKVQKICAGEKKKRARKFLIIEGISWKTGQLCPLLDFLDVAEEFKMRVFLEESYTLGVLGEHGRGMTEHFGVDPSRVDMIFGTLEGAVGSIGGFCAGSNVTIEHQRLSGSGYIFSASLPTYLAKVAIRSIELFEDKPAKLVRLAEEFHGFLVDSCKFEVSSDPKSPFKVFGVGGREEEVHRFCGQNGVHFIRKEDGLLINLNVELFDDRARLEKVYEVLTKAAQL